ncbi:MAG TPA: thioredoxin domain-containing protein [Candidatus Paceibacterota bacterium]|nr:thioredoxin domain-containing protein [Candidatus Paceibacterota bacterium]
MEKADTQTSDPQPLSNPQMVSDIQMSTTTRDMSKIYTPGAIIVAGVLIAGGLFLGLSHNGGAVAQGQPTAAVAPAVNIKDVKTDGEPYIGSTNAPVVMAFWSDYQCPFCKAFEVGGVPQITTPAAFPDILKNYVDTGKLKVVFKDFPFLGNDSTTAAEYGRSIWVLYPDQYFTWRTAMYKAQDQEGDQGFGNAATIDALIKSQFPQISDSAVKADIAKNKSAYDAAMQADEAEGTKFGIQGTPGFIVGTSLIDGAQPLSAFTAAIDPLLKK